MGERFNGDRNETITEEQKAARWDKIHSRVTNVEKIRHQYDGWLEKYERLARQLEQCKTPILDLGCGIGIDTLHLVENGHRVIACDFSKEALNQVKQNIPKEKVKVLQFNMKEKFPFGSELFEFIIANKSIHYFSEKETKNLIHELHRILKTNGIFAFVVNSTNDSNFGAGQGKMLEENFYEVRGTTKRFFDEESLKNFFDNEHWEFIYMKEDKIQGDRIKTIQLQNNGDNNPKIIWTCMVRKK